MSVVETGGADFTAKLDLLVKRYESIVKSLEDPDVFSDVRKYTELAKERTRLEDIVERYRRYIQVKDDIEASLEVLATEHDEDMRALFEENSGAQGGTRGSLKRAPRPDPRDPNDDRSVICEIRQAQAGRKRRCLPVTCSACTGGMLNPRAGRWRSCRPTLPTWAVSKK